MASGANNPLSGYNPPSFQLPDPWDVVQISGQICPGYCTIEGFERKWNWDVKNGKGAQGTTKSYVAKPDVTGRFTFYVWTGQQFTQWEQFRPLFLYDPTKKNIQSVDVLHPSLQDLGITSLVCNSLSPLKHTGHGLFTCVAEMGEFTIPPKAAAVATPTGSNSTTKPPVNPQAPAPTDPQQIKIAQLSHELGVPGF